MGRAAGTVPVLICTLADEFSSAGVFGVWRFSDYGGLAPARPELR